MLFPTSTILAENKRNDKTIQALNTIKIDFAKMTSIKPYQQPFTQCPKCLMLLTEDDASSFKATSLNSFNFLSSKSDSFNELKSSSNNSSEDKKIVSINSLCENNVTMTKKDKVQEGQSNKSLQKVKWYCRYCRQENFSSGKLYFAPNNYKYVLRNTVYRGILPRLILFVVDLSGSMGQTITVEGPKGNLHSSSNAEKDRLVKLSKQLNDMIKSSHFYNKTKHKDKQQLEQLDLYEEKKAIQKEEKQNQNYYSKITFFMAVIEEYIEKIKVQLKNQQFRLGFIFFNEQIFILKPANQKLIPTYSPLTSKNNPKNRFPFDQKFINFETFDPLFREGKKYDRYFGDCNLKRLDCSKLKFENLQVQGQTCLGPALVLALGMASVHDIGSRLIVISDSRPNKGVLSNEDLQANQLAYQQIRTIIKQRQISLGILTWIQQNIKKNSLGGLKDHRIMDTINMQFQKFLKEDRTLLIQEITLDFSIGFSQKEILQKARTTLIGLMKRAPIGKALKVDIRCDNPSIKLEKCKYDNVDFRFMKFLGSCNRNWIQLYAYKLKGNDYLFPIYTQIVIRYEDIFTKQECLFMSYCSHKLTDKLSEAAIAFIQKNPKQLKQLQYSEYAFLESESIRFQNMRELKDMEYISNFDYDNVIPEAYSSKMVMFKQQEDETKECNEYNWNTLAEKINSLNLGEDNEQYL